MKKMAKTSARRGSTIEELRGPILTVTRKHEVGNIRVFGSFARGEQRRTSDIDLLVDLPRHFSLLDLAGLKIDLEAAVGRKVDVVPSDSIKPALRPFILADARPL
jgi:predicted nucleotidyltransferase